MDKNELTDLEREELAMITAARRGDGEVLAALFDRYQPLVRRLWVQCTIADLDRDDWAQEAFLVMHRAVVTYQPAQTTRFCWYFHHLLANRMRDLYRKKAATKRIPAHLIQPLNAENDLATLAASGPTPEEVVILREKRRAFLAACSATERRVILLESQGQAPTEIARLLGCSRARVQNAHHRARAKLKWFLGDQGK